VGINAVWYMIRQMEAERLPDSGLILEISGRYGVLSLDHYDFVATTASDINANCSSMERPSLTWTPVAATMCKFVRDVTCGVRFRWLISYTT
jgi:hypothetical protein